MTISLRVACSAFVVAVLVTLPFAASLNAQDGGIQQAMTPAQFKSAGLDKLSPEELDSLNKWLSGFRETTAKTATKKQERQSAELLVSRVDGVFNGLTGSTVIRLEDGTSWRQANSSDHWRAPGLDHPGAAVIKTVFGRKMRVAGSPEFYVDAVK